MKYLVTPKGELVRDTELKHVKLPPPPDVERLRGECCRLKEQHPRVPVEGVDMWWGWGGIHARTVGLAPNLGHGIRWILEETPAQVETPPEAMPEPPMPVAPDGYEFRRVTLFGGDLWVVAVDNLLHGVQSHPGFAGLFDEFGKYMEHDPMWRDKSGTRWSKYLRSRTPVRPEFVMFRKDGQQ